jgi:hypothetical protein
MIWVTMCMYPLIAYLKFMGITSLGMQQILLQSNLFERRDLTALLYNEPP